MNCKICNIDMNTIIDKENICTILWCSSCGKIVYNLDGGGFEFEDDPLISNIYIYAYKNYIENLRNTEG